MEAKGDCFRRNGKLFLEQYKNEPEARLVHGVVANAIDGQPMSHCWIEHGELCVEFLDGAPFMIPKHYYYELGHVIETVKYSYKEFMENLLQYEHWGHWELNCNR